MKATPEMEMTNIGATTLHTRAESWECDVNGHWNTRFYVRAFQLAAETIFAGPEGISPGGWLIPARHMRFHREVFASQAVTIRSARVRGGEMDGAIAHLLLREGELSATAIDTAPADRTADLPEVAAEAIPMAMPRGLDPGGAADWPPLAPSDRTVMLGPVRSAEVDHTGALTAEALIRRFAIASHDRLNGLGMTPAWTRESRVNRMIVEFRGTLGKMPAAGTILCAESRVLAVGGKTFTIGYRIATRGGETVALSEQCLVSVDLDTRRAVAVPDFLRDALSRDLSERNEKR